MGDVRAGVYLVSIWLLLGPRVAGAQPVDPPPDPPPDPPELPAEPAEPEPPAPPPPPAPAPVAQPVLEAQPAPVVAPVAERYPRALVARPLILPAGGIEGTVSFVGTTFGYGEAGVESYQVAPRLKYGFGSAEVEAGVDLFLTDTFEDSPFVPATEPQRLQAIFLAARLAAGKNLAVGAELTYRDFGLTTSISPRLVLANRRRLGEASTIELGLLGGYDRLGFDDEVMADPRQALVVGGSLRAQAQVTPTFAFEGRAVLALVKRLDDGAGSGFPVEGAPTAVFDQQYGVRALLAATPAVDVFAGFELLDLEANLKLFTIGIAARRVP